MRLTDLSRFGIFSFTGDVGDSQEALLSKRPSAPQASLEKLWPKKQRISPDFLIVDTRCFFIATI